MNKEYTIDALIERFEKHAKRYEEEEKALRKKYEEDILEPYPYEAFNLCYAFLTICKEIKRLSEKINSDSDGKS